MVRAIINGLTWKLEGYNIIVTIEYYGRWVRLYFPITD